MKFKTSVFDNLGIIKKQNPLVGAAAIAGGANALGTVLNYFSNKANNKLQEKMFNAQLDYTKEAELRQYEYMDKAFEREAAYNSPAAQRQRFENAGLNPAMMMQGQNAVVGSMGSPSVPSVPSVPNTQPSHFDFSGIGSAINSYFQNRLLASQEQKTENEGYLLGVQGHYEHYRQQLGLAKIYHEIGSIIKAGNLDDKQASYYHSLREQVEQAISFNDVTWNARFNQEEKKAQILNLDQQKLEQEIQKNRIDLFYYDIEKKLGVEIARSTKKRLDTESLLNGELSKKATSDYFKTILEAAGYVEGTPQYKFKLRELEAIESNAQRLGIFGVSIPGSSVKSLKQRSSNGRLP